MTRAVLWIGAMMAANAALAAPFAYVPNEQQQLNVIDLATNTVVTRITTDSATAGIATDATANRVYVTDAGTRTLQVIDTTTNSTVATLNVCARPAVPALNPAGTRLVIPCRASGFGSGGVAILDTATFNLDFAPADDASAAIWNAQGTQYFVSNRDRVLIFDGSTNQLVGSLGVAPIAFGLAINAAGTRLYVATFQDPSNLTSTPRITVIDLASGATVATIMTSFEPTWIALNPAGTLLFVAMAPADQLAVVSTASNDIVARVAYATGARPSSVAVHPDGSRVYVELTGAGQLDVRQAAPSFLPVASVAYGAAGFAWGNFIGPGSATRAPSEPGYLSGLWWQPSESGWGIQVTKRRNLIVAAWFTYRDTGNPIWYIAPDCAIGVPLSCSGTLYKVEGARFFGGFDFSRARVDVAGSLQLQFTGVNDGGMSYTVGSESRFVPIARTRVATGTTRPPVNFTDLWWNPNESGWGMTITHQPGNMFLAWYVYNDAGDATWLVSSCGVTSAGNGCSGTLLRTTGPPFGPVFDSSRVQSTPAGTVAITFTDTDNGVLSYTVDGVSGSKNITRVIF